MENVLGLLSIGIAAVFALAAWTHSNTPKSRNAEHGELMFPEDPDYCDKHEYAGRHCPDCMVEANSRNGLKMTPVRAILRGR